MLVLAQLASATKPLFVMDAPGPRPILMCKDNCASWRAHASAGGRHRVRKMHQNCAQAGAMMQGLRRSEDEVTLLPENAGGQGQRPEASEHTLGAL